jgi:3-hydroxyacyl-CoA dehydrogenase
VIGNEAFYMLEEGPCALLRQYVKAGRLGRKSGRGVYDYPHEKATEAKAGSSD